MRKKKWNELIIALMVAMVVCGCGKNQETDSAVIKSEINEEVEEEPEEQPIPEKYQNAVRGDAQLIIARGGTILPDDDPEAYRKINGVYYKQYAAKGSTENLLYLISCAYVL